MKVIHDPANPCNLPEILMLCDAATPGPWRRMGRMNLDGEVFAGDADSPTVSIEVHAMPGGNPARDDAEFIAWSRYLVPRMAAEIEALRQDRDRALTETNAYVRRALCGVLDRLGADGATAFMNGDSPEVLSDEIYGLVRELEERALVSSADPSYECDAICPPPALAEGNRCHVKGPHKIHEATSRFTTTWPDRLTQRRVTP